VAGLGEVDAAAGIEELVRRRLLRVVEERFEFTHDRIREVASGGPVPPRRRLLHRQVAETIEALHAPRPSVAAPALGHHFYEPGEWAKAVRYLRRAGQSAEQRSASREAAASFRRALDAFSRLPETPETLVEGIDLRHLLWNALVIVEPSDRLSDL